MDKQNALNYLRQCEDSHDFVPWDDGRHVIRNLMTIYSISEDEAREIVAEFNPTTKA